MRTVAEMDDGIRVAIEYKAKEPRTHLSWSTAARTLVGIESLGRDDVGIVMDLGHSLFAKEAPADVLSLVHEHGRLFTIEVNDNAKAIIVPRAGARGRVYVGKDADAIIHTPEGVEHDIEIVRLDRRAV